MQSLLSTDQGYPQQSAHSKPASSRSRHDRFPLRLVVEATLGDILLDLGTRLKRHACAGDDRSWEPLKGGKQ